MQRVLEANWLLLVGTWGVIASTWVVPLTNKNVVITVIVLTTILCSLAVMGHKQSSMDGGEVTLSLVDVISSTGRVPKVALAVTVALTIALALIDWRIGPERPDGMKLDELADHQHGVRAWLAFLACFQALGVATASSAIKVRNAWMDL